MSTFYPQNDYRGYLSHHGIKGQKWGEQNGPPYPLSTKMHNMVVKGKQKRAAKRREKILHDPKKLYKHRKEFSKEEIDQALAKMESSERVHGKIKLTKSQIKRQQKRLEKERVAADKKLTKKMEKYAATAQMLEQNVDKFTPEELRAALNRVQTKQNVFNAKIDELNRPKKYLDLGLGYIGTAIDAVNKFKNLKNLFTPKYDEHGQTEQDRMNTKAIEYAKELAKKDPTKAFAVLAANSNLTNTYTKLKDFEDKQAKEVAKSKTAKALEEVRNKYNEEKEENQRLRNERDRAVANYAAVQNLNGINSQVVEYFNSTIEDARRNASDMNDWEDYLERNSGGRAFDKITDNRASARHSDLIDEILAVSFSDMDKNFFIAHHGIKGQMWGVKNGPPYPLDAKTHARVKKQKSYKEGSLLDLEPHDKHYYRNGQPTLYYPSSELHKLSKSLFKNNDDKILMSTNPFITDLMFGGVSLDKPNPGAKYIPAHSLKKQGFEPGDIFNDEKYRLDVDTIRKRTPMKMPQYLNDDSSDFLKNQMKKINPGYGVNNGTTNNCAKCSATLTLMKMGYNQVQAGLTDTGSACGSAASWFNGGKVKKTNDLNDIKDALEKVPPGSFGTLGCGRAVNGQRVSGHAMSWTKTRNGKIRIEDGQDTRIYDSFDEVVKVQGFTSGTVATFADLTNATPNWAAMASDGVVQLPGNSGLVNSYGTEHRMDRWSNSAASRISAPEISRSNYSVFNTPMSVAREWDPDLDRD